MDAQMFIDMLLESGTDFSVWGKNHRESMDGKRKIVTIYPPDEKDTDRFVKFTFDEETNELIDVQFWN